MTNRWQLLKTHKLSKKRGFSIEEYNTLSHEYALVCEQIDRLEDELQVYHRDDFCSFKNINLAFTDRRSRVRRRCRSNGLIPRFLTTSCVLITVYCPTKEFQGSLPSDNTRIKWHKACSNKIFLLR